MCQWGGSASVGGVPGPHLSSSHRLTWACSHRPQWCLQHFQERAKACGASWVLASGPGQHHFALFYWPKQVARPVQLQKLEKQTPPPDGSGCTVTVQRLACKEGWRREPSFHCGPISQNSNQQREGFALTWLPAFLSPLFLLSLLLFLSFASPFSFLFVSVTNPYNKDRPRKRVLGTRVGINHFAVSTYHLTFILNFGNKVSRPASLIGCQKPWPRCNPIGTSLESFV